ncbi:MAG: hypothetical protein HZC12_00115, partial [Nitrospirae bacterium]|nr:hypothetical protein [Nitrospirota bacterium]
MRLKVLLDKHEFSEAIKKFFTGEEFEVHNLQERALLLDAVEKGHFNIILLFDTYGLGISDIVAKLKVLDPRSEVIFIGQRDEENTAIEAIKNGATAYFDMPVDMNRFEETLRNIKEMVHIRRETGEIERLLHEKYIFAWMVSKDPV